TSLAGTAGLQEVRRLGERVEPASRLREDRREVRKHLLRLLLDRPAGQFLVPRLQRELPGDEDELTGADRLRVGRTLEGRRGRLGADDGLLSHSQLLLSEHACASATPSALKIAS